MHMKLTKRRALTLCKQQWSWLARNPEKEKWDWPGCREAILESHCVCCEYEAQHYAYDNDCRDTCILPWPGANRDCLDLVSPYMRWINHTVCTADRVKAARAIVRLCNKALAKLPPLKGRADNGQQGTRKQ